MKRLLLILTGALCLAGLGAAFFDPPAADKDKDAKPDEPVRLKKKNRDGAPAPKKDDEKPDDVKPEDKPKDNVKKDDVKKDDQKPDDKDKAKDDDKPQDEEGNPPGPPAEDEAEVLERIGRNMAAVGDKFDNKEVNEGNLQLQDDIIKDLESLIKNNDPNGGGGGGGAQNNDQNQDQDQDKSNQGGGGQQQPKSARTGKPTGKAGQQQARNKGGQGQRQRDQIARNNKPNGNGQNPQQPNNGNQQGNAGNNPGNGGRNQNNPPDPNKDDKTDVWGHLPEALRQSMDSYFQAKDFMAKHKDHISKYYSSIAAQNRRKGE
jgi:hypothetical protein